MTRRIVPLQVNLVARGITARVTLDWHVVELVVYVLLQHILLRERCVAKTAGETAFFFLLWTRSNSLTLTARYLKFGV